MEERAERRREERVERRREGRREGWRKGENVYKHLLDNFSIGSSERFPGSLTH